jgi:predicted lipoprotein with Yx(FWY)xxD motif
MKRIHLILAGVLTLATSAATVASAQQRVAPAHASRTAMVSQRQTGLGKILVSASGRTLYEFTRDRANRDTCAAISGCPEAWPPLQSPGRPLAGSGVRSSLLSTITLRGGIKQVTYAGHPLYLYSGDSGPGETSYVGERAFGGNWYAINSSGHTVK